MEVEEVQSRRASVVHRNGQNMSAAQTVAAVPDSIASFFIRRAQTRSVPPVAEAFTAGPVDIPATATAAAVLTTVRVPVPADVPATAPDAEASQQRSWSAASQECENHPCIAESGQTTTGKPKFCFLHSKSGDSDAWSVAPKTCKRCYHARCYHTPICLDTVITPLRYTTRGGE